MLSDCIVRLLWLRSIFVYTMLFIRYCLFIVMRRLSARGWRLSRLLVCFLCRLLMVVMLMFVFLVGIFGW